MPIDNNETADNMLNELIEEKKKGEKEFLLAIRNAARGHKITSQRFLRVIVNLQLKDYLNLHNL